MAEKFGISEGDEITEAKIAATKKLIVYGMSIADLTGIEHFTALTELNCGRNQLTSLDLSGCIALKELNCDNNQLTSLNVSKNTSLRLLYCSGNQLTSLDVSKNTALYLLGCNHNQLTELDLSENTALRYLGCGVNQLTSLDVSKNTSLESLGCSENKLTSLDVSGCTALTELQCDNNQIKGDAMDVLIASLPTEGGEFFVVAIDENEGNIITKSQVAAAKAKGWTVYDTNYEEYEGRDPNIKAVVFNAENFPDANFRAALTEKIGISEGDEITEAKIAATITLNVGWKSIADLTGIEHFIALKTLRCDYNELTSSLDVSKNTALTSLECSGNQLTSLNVSGCTALTELNCSWNQLTSLDVSKNTALWNLHCDNNQLTKLDLSKNTVLVELYCDNNQLATLDLSNQTNLTNRNISTQFFNVRAVKLSDGRIGIDLGAEGFDAARFTELKGDGTEMTAVVSGKYLIIAENEDGCPGKITYQYNTNYPTEYTTMDVNIVVILREVFLNEEFFPDANFRAALASELSINEGDKITLDIIEGLTSLTVINRPITEFTGIEYFPVLTTLRCWGNRLTELDLSKNTALTSLECSGNQLTSLNVSGCTMLNSLHCGSNQLASLDLTQNTELQYLYCSNNPLTSLDVSKNTKLRIIDCSNNKMAELDLSNQTQMSSSSDLNTQFLTVKAVVLSDGRIGIDLGAEGFDATRFTELKGDGTAMTAVISGRYLVVAENADNCPSKVTYQYDTKFPTETIKMNVDISVFLGDVFLNETYFPDANFRSALASILEINEGDEITVDKIAATTELYVSYKSISDLTGIENFSALETFSCQENQLTEIDVSKNTALKSLNCSRNQLTSLDVSKNTALWNLYCNNNQLTELDLSKNTVLTRLYCDNNQLATLDFSNQPDIYGYNHLDTQYRTDKAVILSDGRVGIELGENLDATRFTELKGDGTARDAVVSGNYLIIAENYNGCPSKVTYKYDVKWHQTNYVTMAVEITIDKSDLPDTPTDQNEIVLQRKYRIHNGSGYNEPAIHLDFGNGQVLHVGYLDTGWWGDYSHTMHGVYIIAGEDWVKASGEDVWRVASTIKDQWVTEKLIVDFNGKVKYYMNGELMGEHTFPGLDLSEAKDVSLDFSPFGWWTGHSHYMDDFSLTTPLASVSDDFNDGVLDADLWQEPVNPDGVREEGGILKMEMLVTDWDYHLKTKTPIPLRLLSENKMFVRMGDTKTAKILVEGECSAASGNEEVATAVVNGDKVEITGVAEGNTTITVTHNESGKTATIDVTVTAGLLLIEGFFPDANFRAALASKFGINEGDEITDEMIAGATQFSFSSKGIADMTGVEYFTELRYLYIYYNQIAKLDVSMLSKLLSLDVDGNQLTELDITKNTALASLDCRNNQLTELDLTQNTALTALYCFGNKLTALDVTQNTALTYLSCYNNQLTALDVTQNTALQTLNCRSNRLTALDVTQNTALQELYCYSNQLTALDVTKNTALTYLSCYNNQLTALDVTQNTSLTRLDCNYNKLTELDLSKNTQLTTLYCGNNQFAELDLSNQTNLGTISISTQYLATKAVKLADGRVGIDLGVEGFDWSRVSELKGDGTEMEAVFSGQYLVIADKVNDSPGKVTYQYDTQHPTEATTMALEITVDLSEFPSGILLNEENFPDANFRAALASKFGINEGDELSMTHIRTTSIDVHSRGVKDLTGIEHFTVLETLSAYYNQIASLDVSMLPNLRSLDVDGNQLTELDLSKNTNLTFLDCRNNQLTELDLSKNTALTGLICYGNQFVVLDLSNQLNNLSSRQVSTQYRTAKAVKLADGRIGIDLGVSGIDAARFTEMTADGTGTTAVVSEHYLVIADNADECPNEVAYQFNTNYPVTDLLMSVVITIDKSDLAKLVLLDNDEGEEYNNPLRIADHVGETIDVVIDGRKLLINGNWNTVCLPFGMSADDLDGWTVKELVGSSYTAATKTLTLDFVDATEMVAGKPYLLRATEPLELYEVGYLESDNRTISDAPAAVIETECVDFVGLYSTFDIAKKDRTLLFMGGDSKLYYPNGAMKIGAFRGYLRLKNGLTAGDVTNGAKEIVLNFGGGEATGVNLIDAESTNDSWYTIDGRKLNGKPTTKGVYVVNGKKVVVK